MAETTSKLNNALGSLVNDEYVSQVYENGEFHSLYEAYGVLEDAVYDVEIEYEAIIRKLAKMRMAVREADIDIVVEIANSLEKYSMLLANETIRVAAICKRIERKKKSEDK